VAALNPDIPIGDLQFYDNYVPALAAGSWRISVGQTLTGVDTGNLGATQAMVVSAPQFALDSNVILNQYPPAGSTGLYAQVLPHIVLNDGLLPWERTMTGSANRQPWLAVLVLTDDELIGGTDSPTRIQTGTVADFLSSTDPAVLKPTVTKEDDVADTDPCTFIQLSTADFTALTPRLEELRFLAHCRQSNISDKAEQGLEQNGLFSVVVGNRFPAVPGADTTGAQKNIAHLVSLEGLEAYLVDQPAFGNHTSVALVSLASWTFNTMPDQLQDFRGLMEQLVGQEYDGTSYTPANLWLRLPAPAINTGTAAGAEASRRIADGFVPMQYQFRTGEQTFAWYRGPCTPVLTSPLNASIAFPTSDAALIYQSAFGIFDASLATAWQTGRALALSDRAFGQALFDFRQRGHQLTDSLLQRLQSDAFSASQISELSTNSMVQDEFLQFLSTDLLQDIGSTAAAEPVTGPLLAAPPAAPDPDPMTAVKNFLADPLTQALIADETATDLEPVAIWLANLLLLYPVPFNLLVPDSRMLAAETLRFFYLDNNWLRALVDGATSIGMQSSRDSFYTEIMGDLVYESATTAAQAMRAQRIGVEPPAAEAQQNLISGFLLRSAVVSGWPNLAVRGGMNDGSFLKTLRMDRLAGDLLICLFWGVPDFVEFGEPQEGFRFGVDDDELPMRQPVAGGKVPLGSQLASPLQVLPDCLRAGGNNVLNIGSATGIVQKIQTALTTAGIGVANFGPADFALQMVKSPEAIRFTSQAS
jgi:hypothetical protein